MAATINSNYVGEALQQMLVRATTGNELVSRGLIRVESNISKEFFIPRMRVGKMLRKRVEQPEDAHSKGDFNIDERKLSPKEFMAFTTFNPRSFEGIWRKWQPTGELVFAELPAEGQSAMLAEMAKVVDFELGGHIINGEYADGSDDEKLMDGILTRISSGAETIKIAAPVAITQGNVIEVLGKMFAKIPKALRGNKNLRFLMSIEDGDKYDNAIIALPNKGADPTGTNAKRFKGVTIETLAEWPENAIVATIASNDLDSNLWLGVGDIDDTTTVKIDRLTNAGEKYFFKMLIKADTNTVWDDYSVLYDARA